MSKPEKSELKQRVLTGSRPSGTPHLGNYFGAYKPAIDLQQRYELYFFLADFHALNERPTTAETRANSLELGMTMLACGLDPKRSCFYAQSGIPEISELSWILSCQTPFGVLTRAHAFKEAQAKAKEVNAGVFAYPVLMAADILAVDATLVPVGQDQKQHIEITRDIASHFNQAYKPVFTIPEPLISEAVATVPGIDGEKMSKSKGNVISILADEKQWRKEVMSIVTDSKGLNEPKDPETCHIFKIYKLVATPEEQLIMAEKYRKAQGFGYGHAKQALLEKIKTIFSPMADRYRELQKRPDDIVDILRAGSIRARGIAQEKLAAVHSATGLLL